MSRANSRLVNLTKLKCLYSSKENVKVDNFINRVQVSTRSAVKVLEDLNIVTEMTGQKKNRTYSYQAYIELLSR